MWATICTDKYLSRWYGIGGGWVDSGFRICVEIDRKPESVCDIQDAVNSKSGIMVRLRLVKTVVEEEANSVWEDEYGLIHGTKVL